MDYTFSPLTASDSSLHHHSSSAVGAAGAGAGAETGAATPSDFTSISKDSNATQRPTSIAMPRSSPPYHRSGVIRVRNLRINTPIVGDGWRRRGKEQPADISVSLWYADGLAAAARHDDCSRTTSYAELAKLAREIHSWRDEFLVSAHQLLCNTVDEWRGSRIEVETIFPKGLLRRGAGWGLRTRRNGGTLTPGRRGSRTPGASSSSGANRGAGTGAGGNGGGGGSGSGGIAGTAGSGPTGPDADIEWCPGGYLPVSDDEENGGVMPPRQGFAGDDGSFQRNHETIMWWLVRDLRVNCIIGINPHEREHKQDVVINLELRRMHIFGPLGMQDAFLDSVEALGQRIEASSFQTVEALALDVSHFFGDTGSWARTRVSVEKPHAVATVEGCGVDMILDWADGIAAD